MPEVPALRCSSLSSFFFGFILWLRVPRCFICTAVTEGLVHQADASNVDDAPQVVGLEGGEGGGAAAAGGGEGGAGAGRVEGDKSCAADAADNQESSSPGRPSHAGVSAEVSTTFTSSDAQDDNASCKTQPQQQGRVEAAGSADGSMLM